MRPAPEEVWTLISRLYAARLGRDFETFRTLLAPDVEWPDVIRGGVLMGPDAIQDYWDYVDTIIRVEVTPVRAHLLEDDRVLVDVNQVVWNMTGQLWSDLCVRHCYTLRDGLIWRMHIVDEEDADLGP